MAKKEMGAYNYLYPIPAVLIGSIVNEKINYEIIGNCGIISMHPATLYISSDKNHYTNIGIRETNVFSINIPSVDNVVEADYCGIVSGSKEDKSEIFKTFYGKINVPMIEECPVNIECKVIKQFELNGMEIFIGEVISSYISEECLENGKPTIEKINPLIYSIKGGYKNIGNWSADPWKVGRKYKKP
jgi:flavin reductase (DIM6/NTAB) family NADH-FMN oxidoreductase RutF